MKIKFYQVDAFSDELFGGNPAGVCPLEDWLPDEVMQNIAFENNLAETAFFIINDADFELRWFTPVSEVDLCGHATLATAHVLFEHLNYNRDKIIFHSRSGELTVKKSDDKLVLNFPIDIVKKIEAPEVLVKAIGKKPFEAFKGKTDYLLVYENQKDIEEINPDFELIKKSKARGVIVTAKGDNVDFVSRFFAPLVGVNEDPVTGSAHTTLTPFWARVLDKNELTATQLSKRKGNLNCKLINGRVEIAGNAVTYLEGSIKI
ncbi:MAG: PhzF family phenazine biosynthesis protein [Ignavibacteria bacterium]|jgi:PhzF family phenazine biosynthesis protein